MILQVALNGARTKDDNPNIPTTSEEILSEAKQSVTAGAQEIHFHVRDKNGKETLDGKFVTEQLSLLREHLSNIPIGISTGEWIEPNYEMRKKLIKEWTVLPDFVSVNFNENDLEYIIKILLKKGISIEAGISNIHDAKKLIDSEMLNFCFRILIEPQELTISDALQNIFAIEKI